MTLVAISAFGTGDNRKCDILVVGCGVLGTSLCKQLLSSNEFSTSHITAITKTKSNHESILQEVGNPDNFSVLTFDQVPKEKQFTNVVFCAPPSGFEDYARAVKDCIDGFWSGPEDGLFVFTSSGGIYGVGDGEVVNEKSPLPDASLASPRSLRLIKAEETVLESNGSILRLAGLYTLERGAHNYWLEKLNGKPIAGSKDGIVNLLHYDDAAGSCLAALKAGPIIKGKVFLISDGNPTTRFGICQSALKSSRYSGKSMPEYSGSDEGGKGKIYDGKLSNQVLNWKARYESFDTFMSQS